MSSLEFDEQAPAPRYRPSGRFNPFVMAPLFVLAAAVALLMAFVLLLLESDFYYYFFTPGVVGIPVFAAIVGVLRWSNCRNALLGMLVAFLLAAIYYVGYWELSYRANVVARGPFAVAMVRQIGGAPGLPGYIRFRCVTSKPVHHPGAGAGNAAPPNAADHVFNYIFFGGEALLIFGLAMALGKGWSTRVYYEAERRWSSRLEFRLPAASLSTVLQAIEVRDWAAIAALPRVSSGGHGNTPSLSLRIEYLKGGADAPAYLTVSGHNLPKDILRAAGIPKPRFATILNQVAIDAPSARQLAQHFPDMKLEPVPASPQPAVDDVLPAPAGELFDPLAGQRPRKEPKAPATDFREPAVAATRGLLDEEEQAQAWAVDSACCLPTGLGRREVRSAAWWKAKTLGSIFALVFVALGLVAWGETFNDALGAALAIVGGTGTLLLFGLLLYVCFGGEAVQKRMLTRRLARQPGSLLVAAAGLPTRLLWVQDAATYHVQKLAPEDVCVCIFDGANRRILLDGISHRYIIRADDVTSFWPLQSGEKISIRIDYTINDVPLKLVLAADNPLAYLFHGIFAHRSFRKLVALFAGTFGRDFPGAGAPAPRPAEV